MKSFIVLLLISYIFTQDPTSVTLDLKGSQTLTTRDRQVKLTVTADKAITLSGLTNLVLQSTEDPSSTISLTCENLAASCAADTATEVTCTVASLTAGSYKLASSGAISMTATGANEQATTGPTPLVVETPTTITVSAPASNNPPTGVTLDLKGSQSLTTTNTQVKLTVTAVGNPMTLSGLTNLVLQSTETAATTIPLTCENLAASCAADTATEVTCTVASLPADTYKLASSGTISMTATYNDGAEDKAVPNTVIPAVAGSPTTITVSQTVVSNDPPTRVTLDLKASQTLTVGTEGSVIIKVTADKAMSLTALSNLVLQSTETASTTIALTCTFTTPVSCTANTAKEVTCKVAAPANAGTYKLAAASDKSISMSATYGSNSAAVSGVTPAVAATPTTLTVNTASNNDNTNTNTNTNANSESDDDNSSFLKFSYIMFFIAFLF